MSVNYDDLFKEFAKNKIDVVTADKAETKVESWVSLGNLAINYAVSGKYLLGGFPTKRTTVLNGEQSSGKTLIGMQACIACQKSGGIAVFIDTEGTFSQIMYEKLGGNLKKLIYKKAHTLEESYMFMEKIIDIIHKTHKDAQLVIVWDSLGDTPSKKMYELETPTEQDIRTSGMWGANVNKKFLQRLSTKISDFGITVIILNTLIDAMKSGPFAAGPSEKMPGGKHLYFHASVINRCITKKPIYEDGENYKTADPVGINGIVSNTKNKVAVPYKKAEYKLFFDKGIHPLSGFMNLLVYYKTLKRKTIQSKEWILSIPNKKEKTLLLGSKDDAEKNFIVEFLKSPQDFFEDDDYDKEKIKLLIKDIQRFNQ